MMNELIEHSNYMLFNYGWWIFTACLLFGVVATFLLYKIDNKTERYDPLEEDPNFTWDEYGNPTIKE